MDGGATSCVVIRSEEPRRFWLPASLPIRKRTRPANLLRRSAAKLHPAIPDAKLENALLG